MTNQITEQHLPPHPGSLVRAAMEDLGLSINAFARKLGVSPATIHRIVTEKSNISPEMAIRLSMTVRQSALFWMQCQAQYDLYIAKNRVDFSQLSPLE